MGIRRLHYQFFYQGARDSMSGVNVLQRWKKNWLGKYWEEVAEENVPAFVKLSRVCFGRGDTSGWKSQLIPLTYEKYG